GNSAGRFGGGINCNTNCYAVIRDNIIAGNTAVVWGGGISSKYYCSCAISNNVISGNTANYGGGISADQWCTPTIMNNLIESNSATTGGGAIYFAIDTVPMIANCTIVSNTADSICGGVFSGDTTSMHTIIDCIIWGNGDDLFDCQATYCCIEDGDVGEGNIHDDPMFVPGQLGDYYLNPLSPCINAGSQSAAAAGLSDRTTQADESLDMDEVDMGYHYALSDSTPPSTIIITSPPDFYYNTILLTWTPIVEADRYLFEYDIGGTVASLEWQDSWLRLIAGDQGAWAGFVGLGTMHYRVSALDALNNVIDGPTEWMGCTCY
ncbi:right-handed parallel beta-helix repeat-containing protein, partial [bacterium]|nr:right-handed parallel beta-helix repeat-containing protein [bacterium]